MADEQQYHIQLDVPRCTGLGLCEAMSPDHFEVQDDGSLVIHGPDVNSGDLVRVRAAVAACPTEALRLVIR
jgi:ferredoxin